MEAQSYFVPELEPTPLPGDHDAESIFLVPKGSPGALIFEHAQTLKNGGEAPFSLSNFMGYGVVPQSAHGYASVPAEWFGPCSADFGDGDVIPGAGINFIGAGIGSAAKGIVGSLSAEGLLRRSHDQRIMYVWPVTRDTHDYRRAKVVSFKRAPDLSQGDRVFLFKDGAMDQNEWQQKSHRTWMVHDDGTIGPLAAKHLVLGMPLPGLRCVSARRMVYDFDTVVLEHAAELRQGGRSVPLTFANPPGYAIVSGSGQHDHKAAGLETQHLVIGPASHALTARLDKQPDASADVSFSLITSTDPSSQDFVATGEGFVDFTQLDPTKYPTAASRHAPNDEALGGRIFTVTEEGTVAPVAAEYKKKAWRTHKGDKAQTALPPSEERWGYKIPKGGLPPVVGQAGSSPLPIAAAVATPVPAQMVRVHGDAVRISAHDLSGLWCHCRPLCCAIVPLMAVDEDTLIVEASGITSSVLCCGCPIWIGELEGRHPGIGGVAKRQGGSNDFIFEYPFEGTVVVFNTASSAKQRTPQGQSTGGQSTMSKIDGTTADVTAQYPRLARITDVTDMLACGANNAGAPVTVHGGGGGGASGGG